MFMKSFTNESIIKKIISIAIVVYLAAVMDLYNREIIGYAISKTIDAELACRGLRNAISKSGRAKELLFHSDRGSQYCSKKIKAY